RANHAAIVLSGRNNESRLAAARIANAWGPRLELLLGLELVELAAELVAQGRAAGVRGVEALGLGRVLGARRALDRQADLALGAVGVEHLDLHDRARLQHGARILDVVLADLGDVDQALD